MRFDANFNETEQLPKYFEVTFKEENNGGQKEVVVLLNGLSRVGDKINDNSYTDDFYRYHDIFHYSFATILGWSPCTRAMMRRKRKSNKIIDEVEDGARATITEEAISLLIFNEAKRKHFFNHNRKISKTMLKIIKEMTEPFEVKVKTRKEWEYAILKAYEIFRLLMKNRGGKVEFNALEKKMKFVDI